MITAFLKALPAVVLLALVPAGTASAAIGIDHFAYASTDAGGAPSTQAGAHPSQVQTTFAVTTHVDGNGATMPDESVRNLAVDLPVGLVGDATAVPTCTEPQLVSQSCPDDTAVGTVALEAPGSGLPFALNYPVYNMAVPPGVPAQFGFWASNVAVHLQASVRSGSDYGITVTVKDLPQTLPWTSTTVTFWGVPADPGHDGLRGSCLGIFGPSGSTCPSTAPRAAFLTNPSACAAVNRATAHVDSWQSTGVFAVADAANRDSGGAPVGITGCDRLPFAPTVSVRPSVTTAGAPAGLAVRVHVPQTDDPDGVASATLRRAVVTLPAGMTVSPSSADGLGACAPAQIGLHDGAPPSCPETSKIGTVRIDTPLLDDPLTGSVYLAQQRSNPFSSLLAIYVVAAAHGVVVKLAGHVEPDPTTGQLRTTFDDAPQLPFTDFALTFKDGPRAPLSNPPRCGTYTTTAQLAPYGAGPTATPADAFTIDQGCARGFAPTFSAGTTNPAAGATTAFTMTLSRSDADAELDGMTVALPPGLLAHLDRVPLCDAPAAASGGCPAETRVGTTTVGAGPGADPFHLSGPVYLAGPYKGAPFSLSIVVPAVAGPLDLGTVVVRAAVGIDPRTAAVTVASDPLPTILQGIPLRLRRVDVTIDRPGFMVNPTSCAPSQVVAAVRSTEGTTAPVATRFQAADCAKLGYRPALSMALTGKGQTIDGKHPGLVAHLAPRSGDANSRTVTATMPLALALDPDNANGLCEPEEAAANRCPATSIVGSARAVSVLHEPLRAPVYFVHGFRTDPKSGRKIPTLPKLFIPLAGEGVRIDVDASSDVVDERLVTTFDDLPDAPLSSFDLTIAGGKHGILVVSDADVCQGDQEADVAMAGQNGRTATTVVRMATPCPLRVLSAGHSASALKVVVGGLGAGRVTVSGRGLTTARRTLAHATVATVAPRFTATARRALARGRDMKVRVRVAFLAQGAKRARTTTRTLTVHG